MKRGFEFTVGWGGSNAINASSIKLGCGGSGSSWGSQGAPVPQKGASPNMPQMAVPKAFAEPKTSKSASK